jgi:hypothetical protein
MARAVLVTLPGWWPTLPKPAKIWAGSPNLQTWPPSFSTPGHGSKKWLPILGAIKK